MIGTLRKVAAGISFLLVLVVVLLFLYVQSSFTGTIFYPGHEADWNRTLNYDVVILALVLPTWLILDRKALKKLADASYWRSFVLRFVPVAIVSIIVFVALQALIGRGDIDVRAALGYMPLGVLILNAFVITQVEEIMFRGLIYDTFKNKWNNKVAYIGSSLAFAIFHYGASGGSLLVMATYIPLGFAFCYVRNNGLPYLGRRWPRFFGPTPETQQANAAVHFSWNMLIIGFLRRPL